MLGKCLLLSPLLNEVRLSYFRVHEQDRKYQLSWIGLDKLTFLSTEAPKLYGTFSQDRKFQVRKYRHMNGTRKYRYDNQQNR